MSTSLDILLCKEKMTTIVGVYKGFALHLRMSLLVQDDSNHNESSTLDIESCTPNSDSERVQQEAHTNLERSRHYSSKLVSVNRCEPHQY